MDLLGLVCVTDVDNHVRQDGAISAVATCHRQAVSIGPQMGTVIGVQ